MLRAVAVLVSRDLWDSCRLLLDVCASSASHCTAAAAPASMSSAQAHLQQPPPGSARVLLGGLAASGTGLVLDADPCLSIGTILLFGKTYRWTSC